MSLEYKFEVGTLLVVTVNGVDVDYDYFEDDLFTKTWKSTLYFRVTDIREVIFNYLAGSKDHEFDKIEKSFSYSENNKFYYMTSDSKPMVRGIDLIKLFEKELPHRVKAIEDLIILIEDAIERATKCCY